MLQLLDDWLDITNGFVALAAVESVVAEGFPLASHGRAASDNRGNRETADLFEIKVEIAGEDVGGAMDTTLNVYTCPDGVYAERSTEPRATRTGSTSGGTAPEADLVTNGAFAADSDWITGPGWVIAAGAAAHSTSGGRGELSQEVVAVEGEHLLTFDIVVDPDPVLVYVGSQLIGKYERIGSYRTLFTRVGGTADLRFVADGLVGIDNVVVRRVYPYRFGYVGSATTFGSGVAFGLLPGADMTNTYWRAWVRRYQQAR